MNSKTIILSSPDEKGRGIMTIYTEDDLLQIRLRLYNVEDLSKDCKIGIYHDNKTYTANILKKSDVYLSSMVGDFDMQKDFYSAIIDTANNNTVKLSGGTYAGYFFNDNSVFETIKEDEDNISNQKECEISQNLKQANNIAINENQIIPNCEENDCDKCKNCKYKEYFYSHTEQELITTHETLNNFEETTQDEKSEPILCETEEKVNMENIENDHTPTTNEENETNTTILQSLLPQFKYVFENYPEDKELIALLPNSKFVKISDSKDQYSLGALYENEQMKYICYAVLSNYNSPAPQELGEHYQWLPIDKEDPLSEGYYVVFQDAQDLKIVEL